MAFSSASLCALLLLVAVALRNCAAATTMTGEALLLPQEVYWKTLLPKTPMPAILQYLLHADVKVPYSLTEKQKDIIPAIRPMDTVGWRGDETKLPDEQKDLPIISPQAFLRWKSPPRAMAVIRSEDNFKRPDPPPTADSKNGVPVDAKLSDEHKDLPIISPQAFLRWKSPPRAATVVSSKDNLGRPDPPPTADSKNGLPVDAKLSDEQKDLPIISPQAFLRWKSPPRAAVVVGSEDNFERPDPPPTAGSKNGLSLDAKDTLKHEHDGVAHKRATGVLDYILYKNLHPGWKITLHVLQSTARSGFLPRSEADSIPFSSSALPEILARFSIRPNSMESAIVKSNLEFCGNPAEVGEEKACATSLESMVEFAVATLGTPHVKASATRAVRATSTRDQPYTIVGVREMEGSSAVACHPVTYPYAVFYCHRTDATRTFKVLAAGEDGTLVDAIVVCHMDTTMFNPKHPAFAALEEKPGVAVCHFNPVDNILWTVHGEIVQEEDGGRDVM